MALPSTQKALVVPEARAPWKLIDDWPIPTPGPREILVKVVAAALNPSDWKIQTIAPPFVSYPFIGGKDGAGIVEALGSEVEGVALVKGDKV